MAFVVVVTPAFNPDAPELNAGGSWPPGNEYYPAAGCQFSYYRESDQTWVPHLEYGEWLKWKDLVQNYFPEFVEKIYEVPYYVDYYRWPVPDWWQGTASVNGWPRGQGWYFVSIPKNNTRLRVGGGEGMWQIREKLISWDEDDDEGMPNFGIVVYPDWWWGSTPW